VFDVFLRLCRTSGQEKRTLTRTRKYTFAQRGLPAQVGWDNSDEVRKTVSSLSLGLLASLGLIYSCVNHFGSRVCNLNSAERVRYLSITNMAAEY
jgi:hypothetical protein